MSGEARAVPPALDQIRGEMASLAEMGAIPGIETIKRWLSMWERAQPEDDVATSARAQARQDSQ